MLTLIFNRKRFSAARTFAWFALAVALFSACLSLDALAAQVTATIANDAVRAEFGERGLRAVIEQRARGAVRRVTSDEFSFSINAESLISEEMKTTLLEKKADKVRYRYENSRFGFDVIYELRPGWRFVSKQIVVTKAPTERFHVRRVEAFRLTLEDDIADMHVPGTYVPHYRPVHRPQPPTGDYGAFVRFPNSQGLFLTVQNPFLTVHRQGKQVSISYEPEMDWQQTYGNFSSDRGCLGLYQLSGRRLPSRMTTEWELPAESKNPSGFDQAEIDAFTDCVRAFLMKPPVQPARVEVGWTLNDYQIDVATAEGREQYKRVIDSTADLGLTHIVYTPANSKLARPEEDSDDWKWEHILWLNLGPKIRRGEWGVRTGAIPPEVTEMLDYARSKNVLLVAYAFPSLPFAGDKSWIVPTRGAPGAQAETATLASRAFQDYFTDALITFARRTGVGGYSFDYAFLHYPGNSVYAQWWGWRRVMENLRRALPDIVIDGRQIYVLYGPWSWLAGTYPHPTGHDEQPHSFNPFPDLHFSRVSADRQRYVAYWYRNHMFAPTEILPGYITHQTERTREVTKTLPDGRTVVENELMLTDYRQRDWDYLGWRYSLLSSIGTAGWNHVVSMIPARDVEEHRNFSDADKSWFRKWLDWSTTHRELLRHTRSITGPPAIGRVDGTSAISGDRGFVFLFNPNYKRLPVTFRLDQSIGLGERGQYLIREIEPQEGKLLGKPAAGFWTFGDAVTLDMDGTSARVLEVVPASESTLPVLFNAAGKVSFTDGVLSVTEVRGEAGTEAELLVRMKPSQRVEEVRVGNRKFPHQQRGELVLAPVRFAGRAFARSQQVELNRTEADAAIARMSGSFSIPQRIFDQLAQRKRAWPIPWTKEDYKTTWLAPERLLLYVQMAEQGDDTPVSLRIDGKAVELKRAYSSVHAQTWTFVGWYADVSDLQPDREHAVELSVPAALKPGQLQGLFFDNVETEHTEATEVP